MAGKASLCKYSWKRWANKEDNRPVNTAGSSYHFKKFSAIGAMMAHATSVRMEALRLPRVLSELYPLSVERFSDATPWDLCHTFPRL